MTKTLLFLTVFIASAGYADVPIIQPGAPGEVARELSAEEARQYLESMKRLLDFPIRVVHGGHYPSYDAARHRKIILGWLAARDA